MTVSLSTNPPEQDCETAFEIANALHKILLSHHIVLHWNATTNSHFDV